MSEATMLKAPAVDQKEDTAKSAPILSVTYGTYLGSAPCNLFIPNTSVPVKDEDGRVVIDPNRRSIVLDNNGKIEEHTAKLAAVQLPRAGQQVCVVWKAIEGFNGGKPFAYTVTAL